MPQNNGQIDFLAIGDMVIDDFIFLQDAHVTCKIDHTACELAMRFGDKIPYKGHQVLYAVGNAANAAVSAARIGQNSTLAAWTGKDEYGNKCLETLENEKVGTQLITQEEGKMTNYHYVLSYDVDRTILIKHEKYSYTFEQIKQKLAEAPKWIYFSSIADNTEAYHQEVAAYLAEHPETKLAFQPGTFQLKLGFEGLKNIYAVTELFVCNVEEAQGLLKTENRDLPTLLKGIAAQGPKIVCITDGPAGAYMLDTYTNEAYFMPIYPDPKPPVERTGAGDAFTSTFTAMLLNGKTPKEALVYAPINSMSVVQEIGAQKGLLTLEQLEKFLADAPSDYQPKLLVS